MDYCEYLFKFVVIGDSGVGKSSLMLRFTDGVFSEQYISTIGVNIKVRTLELDGSKVKIQVWDTAGQDRFRSIVNSYYRGAHGVILVYDVTNKESFDNIALWKDSVDKHANSDAIKILVGNKADLEAKRVIGFDRGQDLSNHLGISFMETSAKDKTNVEHAFVSMAAEIKAKVGTTIEQSTCTGCMPGLKVNCTELTASTSQTKGACKC